MFNLKGVVPRSTLLLSALLGGPAAQGAPAGSRLDTKALDQFVLREMKDYNVPGVGLAVVENGKITYVRGYGVRDVVTRQPVNAGTQFAIGSVTKSFTALGLMRLVDRGLVGLDTPVIRYLPELKLMDARATRTITVRNLLTHTTGLSRDDTGFDNPKQTLAEIIASVARTPMAGKPGGVFVYSNANAILAGAVISRVTGRSWEAYTRGEVLRPLGMNKTNFTGAEMRRTGNFATPHAENVLKGLTATPFYVLGGRAAAGAINSSAADMARYVQYQVGSGAPLLNTQSFRAMHTRFIQTVGVDLGDAIGQSAAAAAKQRGVRVVPSPLSDSGYAFFWGTEKFQGRDVVEHGGNTDGFTANVSLLPGTRSGVAVLVNREHADYFIEALRWHVLQTLIGTQPSRNTSAILQDQLRLLGEDNVTRRARTQAARTYQPGPGELGALQGRYASTVGGPPVQVQRSGNRFLRLKASLQGVTFDVTLVPVGRNEFISNSQPLVGTLFSFKRQEDKQQIVLEGSLGEKIPVGERPIRGR